MGRSMTIERRTSELQSKLKKNLRTDGLRSHNQPACEGVT